MCKDKVELESVKEGEYLLISLITYNQQHTYEKKIKNSMSKVAKEVYGIVKIKDSRKRTITIKPIRLIYLLISWLKCRMCDLWLYEWVKAV